MLAYYKEEAGELMARVSLDNILCINLQGERKGEKVIYVYFSD